MSKYVISGETLESREVGPENYLSTYNGLLKLIDRHDRAVHLSTGVIELDIPEPLLRFIVPEFRSQELYLLVDIVNKEIKYRSVNNSKTAESFDIENLNFILQCLNFEQVSA